MLIIIQYDVSGERINLNQTKSPIYSQTKSQFKSAAALFHANKKIWVIM